MALVCCIFLVLLRGITFGLVWLRFGYVMIICHTCISNMNVTQVFFDIFDNFFNIMGSGAPNWFSGCSVPAFRANFYIKFL